MRGGGLLGSLAAPLGGFCEGVFESADWCHVGCFRIVEVGLLSLTSNQLLASCRGVARGFRTTKFHAQAWLLPQASTCHWRQLGEIGVGIVLPLPSMLLRPALALGVKSCASRQPHASSAVLRTRIVTMFDA